MEAQNQKEEVGKELRVKGRGEGVPAIQSFDQTDESGSGNEAERGKRSKEKQQKRQKGKRIQLSSCEDVINRDPIRKRQVSFALGGLLFFFLFSL